MSALTPEEREALWRAGDHCPDLCDCTGYAEEVRYEPGFGEVCGGFEDTLEAVERIVAEHVAAAKAEALREAADAIQALHPGEVKNSVIWLRDRADRIEGQR